MLNPVISVAERGALALALIMLALHTLDLGNGLEYRQALLAAEPWRALTGHVVHINWPHALVNAAALWVIARLYAPDLGAVAQSIVLVLTALVISVALALVYPSIAWYRGSSGALHGLYFAGAVSWLIAARPRSVASLWLPALLFAGGWIKVIAEQPGGATTLHADWLGAAVVPQAHLVGALCGSALGALLAALQARGQQQGGKHEQLP